MKFLHFADASLTQHDMSEIRLRALAFTQQSDSVPVLVPGPKFELAAKFRLQKKLVQNLRSWFTSGTKNSEEL